MERVHRPRHISAALLLAAVAAGYGYFAVYDDRVAGEQIRAATVALKEAEPALYAHDPEFGPGGVWRGHSPLFQAMLKLVLVPAGYEDSMLTFRAMAPVMALVFVLGMYALIYRQCRSWSVSVFVAVLSSTVTGAPGGFAWGFGPVATATSGGLCLALSPLLVLGFLSCTDPGSRGRRRGRGGEWKLLLVFACVGLLGNVDLSVSINMTLVLVGAYLLRRRMSLRAWPMGVGCVLAAAAAAIPQGVYLLRLRQSITVRPEQGAAAADVVEALRQADLRVMFPVLAREFLDGLLACGVVILLAGAVLIRIGRFRARNLGFWAAMLASALLVSLGLQGMFQLVAALLGRPPAAIDFVRAAPLAMLPLYVMAAQTITNLLRLWRRGNMVRWGCVGLLAVWMIPSDNLRVLRHGAYGLMTAHVPEANIPARFRRRLRKRAERRARRAELARIARWARSNTSADAVFFTGEPEFRMLSRRSILAGEDVRWTFYLAPGRLAEWMARAERLRLLLEPPTGRPDAEALHKFIIDFTGEKGTQWEGVDEWYAILDADAAPEESAWLKYVPAAEKGWGTHLVVARVQ